MEKKVYEQIKKNGTVQEHAPKQYQYLIWKMRENEKERQDVLHILELRTDLEEEQYVNLLGVMQEVLKERRFIKDEIIYYKNLIEMITNKEKITFKRIREVLAEVTAELDNRVYYLKKRVDLKEFVGGDIRMREDEPKSN